MALLSIDSWQPFPDANGYSTDNTELRVWYSRSFIDSDGISVQSGTGTTGFYITSAVTITLGVPSIASFSLRTTIDAIDPAPQSIQVFARLFSNNVAKAWVFAGNAGPTGWVIPNPTPLTSMTYEQLAIYNQTTVLANPPLTFWTASQIQAYFDSLSPAPNASDVTKGITKLSVSPRSATNPIAWGFNDASLPSGFLNVKGAPYYAVGDGVADDTAAIQAAIDAATNSGIVYIPSGDYLITSSLTLASVRSIIIMGGGYSTRIINGAGANNPTFNMTSAEQFRLSNFSIIGQTANPNEGIELLSCAFGSFEDLLINSNGIGILFADLCSTISVVNCEYWPSSFANGASGTRALRLAGIAAQGTTINDIHIDRCNISNFAAIADSGAAIKWDTTNSTGVTITNCELENSSGPNRSLYLAGIQNLLVSGCYIDNNNVTLLRIRTGSVTNNYGGVATTYNIGDGTAPNLCLNTQIEYAVSGTLTIDSQSIGCGAFNSDFETAPGYVNNGVAPATFNVQSTGGARVADVTSTAGIKISGSTVTLGTAIAISFSAGNYTSSSGTWVVGSGDLVSNGNYYTRDGDRITYHFYLTTTTITGTPSELRIAIPGGLLAAKRAIGIYTVKNNGGSFAAGTVEVIDGNAFITLYPTLNAGNFAAGADNNDVNGWIEFQIVP